MPRALPLQTAPDAAAENSHDASAPTTALSGTVSVYDPAMCCPTGVCGPGVDPALLQVARDLRWLAARGATVERFGLSQEPQAFVANVRVAGLLQAFGDGALPAVLVNGTVLCHGRYPSRDELAAALGAASAPQDAASPRTSTLTPASGCTPGSGCC